MICMASGWGYSMDISNKLSIARVLLIPFIVIALYINTPAARIIGLIIYLVAAATDFLDGAIARKYNLITNFGKFIDPVADKLLVLSTMCMFVSLNELPAYVFIIILCRELAVDGLRLVASTQNVVIAASKYGKYKTSLQMLALIFYFTNNAPFGSFPIKQILIVLALIMTIISGVDYFIKNKKALKGA